MMISSRPALALPPNQKFQIPISTPIIEVFDPISEVMVFKEVQGSGMSFEVFGDFSFLSSDA